MEAIQENKTKEASSEIVQNGTVVKVEVEREEQERTTAAKLRFLEFYDKTLCNIRLAAKASEVGRNTVYQWIKNDPEFKLQMDSIKTELPEMFEEELKEMALKKDGSMIRFWLSRRHPDYKMKVEHSGVVINIYGTLTDEQKFERLRRIVATRGSGVGKRGLDLLNGGNLALPENGSDSQKSGTEIKGSGAEPQGDIPIAPGPLENNGNNDRVRDTAPIEKSEPPSVGNQ